MDIITSLTPLSWAKADNRALTAWACKYFERKYNLRFLDIQNIREFLISNFLDDQRSEICRKAKNSWAAAISRAAKAKNAEEPFQVYLPNRSVKQIKHTCRSQKITKRELILQLLAQHSLLSVQDNTEIKELRKKNKILLQELRTTKTLLVEQSDISTAALTSENKNHLTSKSGQLSAKTKTTNTPTKLVRYKRKNVTVTMGDKKFTSTIRVRTDTD